MEIIYYSEISPSLSDIYHQEDIQTPTEIRKVRQAERYFPGVSSNFSSDLGKYQLSFCIMQDNHQQSRI